MKVCLAGNVSNEVIEYLSTLEDNSINILQSFIDYQKENKTTNRYIEMFLKKSKFFLLDSGAFSMIYGNKKVELDVYVNGYINFIKQYKIKHYIELDLYNVIGVKETEQLRAKIEKEIGYQSIPVFHKSLGLDYFKQLTKDYQYIAIGGIAIAGRGGLNVSLFSKLNEIAKANDCKTHGLGYTTLKNLDRTGFYSVDSTSWLAPLRFASALSFFDGGTIQKLEKPVGKRLKTNEVRIHQLKEWLKYQKFAEHF